jgi:K+-transporting ATPase KdpF subunit
MLGKRSARACLVATSPSAPTYLQRYRKTLRRKVLKLAIIPSVSPRRACATLGTVNSGSPDHRDLPTILEALDADMSQSFWNRPTRVVSHQPKCLREMPLHGAYPFSRPKCVGPLPTPLAALHHNAGRNSLGTRGRKIRPNLLKLRRVSGHDSTDFEDDPGFSHKFIRMPIRVETTHAASSIGSMQGGYAIYGASATGIAQNIYKIFILSGLRLSRTFMRSCAIFPPSSLPAPCQVRSRAANIDNRKSCWPAESGKTRCGMVLEYILGGAVTLFIAAYLIYALLRPERF